MDQRRVERGVVRTNEVYTEQTDATDLGWLFFLNLRSLGRSWSGRVESKSGSSSAVASAARMMSSGDGGQRRAIGGDR